MTTNATLEAHGYYERVIRERGYRLTTGELQAGDATFHSGWTLHSAPGNASRPTARQVITIVYYADGAFTYAPMRGGREDDFRAYMPGVTPGELAVSHLNPLVYREEA